MRSPHFYCLIFAERPCVGWYLSNMWGWVGMSASGSTVQCIQVGEMSNKEYYGKFPSDIGTSFPVGPTFQNSHFWIPKDIQVHICTVHTERSRCAQVCTGLQSIQSPAMHCIPISISLILSDSGEEGDLREIAIKDCCQVKRDAWVVLANIIFGCTCHYHCKETSSSLSNPTSQQLLRIVTTVQFGVHPNS